jgi:hypothetical protein
MISSRAAGNLHDPAPFSALECPRSLRRRPSRQALGLNDANRPFLLTISCLSYAFLALLRRNIIAFQVPEHPYFAGKSDDRREPVRNERE